MASWEIPETMNKIHPSEPEVPAQIVRSTANRGHSLGNTKIFQKKRTLTDNRHPTADVRVAR
jgi:hypothetical protein